jgi:WD40 repeat protein
MSVLAFWKVPSSHWATGKAWTAIRRDIHFIAHHAQDYPQGLYQCLWNHGWWYDCPEAARYYQVPNGGWKQQPPWQRAGPKLHEWFEKWRIEQETQETIGFWLRSHRPPPVALGSPLKAVLRGHEGRVTSVAFSPDGHRVASGSDDHTLRVWGTEVGECLAVLCGHEDRVTGVAFSSDGRRIVSGSHDCTLRIWDARTGQQLSVLRGHEDWINSVAFSPDGRHVASGSGMFQGPDSTVRVWDAKTGQQLAVMSSHSEVTSVAFSPDGQHILSGSPGAGGTVCLWDAKSGRTIAFFDGGGYAVRSVSFSSDGRYIICGNNDWGVPRMAVP